MFYFIKETSKQACFVLYRKQNLHQYSEKAWNNAKCIQPLPHGSHLSKEIGFLYTQEFGGFFSSKLVCQACESHQTSPEVGPVHSSLFTHADVLSKKLLHERTGYMICGSWERCVPLSCCWGRSGHSGGRRLEIWSEHLL